MNITKETANNKEQLLKYFRDRSSEFLAEVNGEYGNTEYKKKAKKLPVTKSLPLHRLVKNTAPLLTRKTNT